jgi:L-ascorbate metabolism protein UlaG (beta-lactamase superfamily)
MSGNQAGVGLRYLGGPTALLELGGLRLLTDPTFDPPGDYPVGSRVLRKTIGALVTPDQAGPVDAVLLSHDQHPDNLDGRGRGYLGSVPLVLSTAAARQRLGGTVRALESWQHVELPRAGGPPLRVTGVPARHGPPGCEPVTGPVTGFVLTGDGLPTVYVSGDNAALEHAGAVADRFGPVDVAILFAGAARTALLDGAYLTLTSAQAAQAAVVLGARHVVPLHFEGWAHFSQGRDTLESAFTATGIRDRLRLPGLGDRVTIFVP